ncbi:hypothetical protein KIN20_015821 [Parelaphostrongylus tenuis]|uniref:DUF7774 domain-containing protein n=1 Tax=Parelaphostrongylus tenuis TaxID=148309 RepID=A0AAD5MJ31_PARTN|nr:hypothetical protein KIN20_015821 [Parelaphostrongylus tenuis]
MNSKIHLYFSLHFMMSDKNRKKSNIGAQLNRKKDLIRALFRASHDGSPSERSLGHNAEQASCAKTNRPCPDEKTIFEKVESVSRPFIVSQDTNQRITSTLSKLDTHFKECKAGKESKQSRRPRSSQQSSKAVHKRDLGSQNRRRSSKPINQNDLICALRVMREVKKTQMLENILDENETEIVRHFFETEMSSPSHRVMRLLHKAFDKCWEKIMDDCDQFHFSRDILVLLSEKQKAKEYFFDVMLVYPEFIPVSWAGPHIVEISEPLPYPAGYSQSEEERREHPQRKSTRRKSIHGGVQHSHPEKERTMTRRSQRASMREIANENKQRHTKSSERTRSGSRTSTTQTSPPSRQPVSKRRGSKKGTMRGKEKARKSIVSEGSHEDNREK